MKILVLDKFYKTVPKEKKSKVMEKVQSFIDELESSYRDIRKVSPGFRPVKIKTSNKSIWKFRVDDQDRILYTYVNEFYSTYREEYSNCLVLLQYCNHDNQIRNANNMNYSLENLSEHVEESIVYENNSNESVVVDLSLENSFPIIVDIEQIESVFEGEGHYYYLDKEQQEFVHFKNKGEFVFGSAGSGKTTIAIYKLIHFLKETAGTDKSICYFTYSKLLRDKTEQFFWKMAEDLYDMKPSEYKGRVFFYTIEDFLENRFSQKRILTYERFKEWAMEEPSARKFEAIDLWKERRGILQGMIGADWQHTIPIATKNIPNTLLVQLEKNNYIVLNKNRSAFTINDSEDIHSITSFISTVAEKPEDFKKIVYDNFNKYIHSKRQLDDEEYKSLNTSYTLFKGEQREQFIKVCQKFQRYLSNVKKENLYDEGIIVREALIQLKEIFDFIIIDEVQDLTELQVYFLCHLVRDKRNIFVSGDFHQTINPTFFSVGRVESIFRFLGGIDNFIDGRLEKNYRSSKNIVMFSNALAELRKDIIHEKLEYSYKEIAKRDVTDIPFLYEGDKKELWECVKDKSYLSIVVATNTTKEKLLQAYPELRARVLTVSEIKGIEEKYIVTYNIMSDFKKQWENIFSSNRKQSESYRYYFNLVYVAITRAREYLCMIEDDICEETRKWLLTQAKEVSLFDAKTLQLQENSTDYELLLAAMNYEKNGHFENAIAQYNQVLDKSSELTVKKQAEKGISRCQILKEYMTSKNAVVCGEKLFTLDEYEKAIPYLKKGENEKLLLEAILLSKEVKRYDLVEEMNRFQTNPLSVLLKINKPAITRKYIQEYIEPTKKLYTEAVNQSIKSLNIFNT